MKDCEISIEMLMKDNCCLDYDSEEELEKAYQEFRKKVFQEKEVTEWDTLTLTLL